jgi:hypothetical protein
MRLSWTAIRRILLLFDRIAHSRLAVLMDQERGASSNR